MNRRRFQPRQAVAFVWGSERYPDIKGTVSFRAVTRGVLVTADIYGLPDKERFGIFAFHVHNGSSCTGNSEDLFADADGHYNPTGMQHPYHAGDLPPLFGNSGYAYMSVLTDRFTLDDVIGKVVIIHRQPDDFTTQSAGNSGEKIACGKIMER